jgi:SAM-dependent methyltransferase
MSVTPIRTPSDDEAMLMLFTAFDNSSQTTAFREVERHYSQDHDRTGLLVLDVGAGSGSSFDEFKRFQSDCRWVGIDLPFSAEVSNAANRINCVTYDGVRVPFGGETFDLVYSRQVFEHVEHPSTLLTEIHRVLKPHGHLIGSTSQLEPFHSRSIQNFTPFGFALALQRSGFKNIVLRPGIDGISLILRRPFARVGLARLVSRFENESLPNQMLELFGRLTHLGIPRRNALKLLFSGHFTFVASKVVS